MFTVAWPTGEFGGMGLEGAVKLGHRNELAAIDDSVERAAMFSDEQAVAFAGRRTGDFRAADVTPFERL